MGILSIMQHQHQESEYPGYPNLTSPAPQTQQTEEGPSVLSAWKSAIGMSCLWVKATLSYNKVLGVIGMPLGAALFHYAFRETAFGPFLFTTGMGALIGKLAPEALLPLCVAFGVVKRFQN